MLFSMLYSMLLHFAAVYADGLKVRWKAMLLYCYLPYFLWVIFILFYFAFVNSSPYFKSKVQLSKKHSKVTWKVSMLKVMPFHLTSNMSLGCNLTWHAICRWTHPTSLDNYSKLVADLYTFLFCFSHFENVSLSECNSTG